MFVVEVNNQTIVTIKYNADYSWYGPGPRLDERPTLNEDMRTLQKIPREVTCLRLVLDYEDDGIDERKVQIILDYIRDCLKHVNTIEIEWFDKFQYESQIAHFLHRTPRIKSLTISGENTGILSGARYIKNLTITGNTIQQSLKICQMLPCLERLALSMFTCDANVYFVRLLSQKPNLSINISANADSGLINNPFIEHISCLLDYRRKLLILSMIDRRTHKTKPHPPPEILHFSEIFIVDKEALNAEAIKLIKDKSDEFKSTQNEPTKVKESFLSGLQPMKAHIRKTLEEAYYNIYKLIDSGMYNDKQDEFKHIGVSDVSFLFMLPLLLKLWESMHEICDILLDKMMSDSRTGIQEVCFFMLIGSLIMYIGLLLVLGQTIKETFSTIVLLVLTPFVLIEHFAIERGIRPIINNGFFNRGISPKTVLKVPDYSDATTKHITMLQ